MPGSGQWNLLTKLKDECWICSQKIFTVFLWSVRIGQIGSVSKDQSDFYIKQIQHHEQDNILPEFSIYEVPHIGGYFNDWAWKPMRNVVDFCIECDLKPPNFIKMMVD